MATEILDAFIAPVSRWFRQTFEKPTPPQTLGWPPIQRGEHTLILAPTGSGKTLAAFLCGINDLYAKLARGMELKGVELLYVSPLKALNNDIERNLRAPLAGIRQAAAELGQVLPPLRVAVRTGDTPPAVRATMIRRPPHILITTPESLYLMLTSPRARDIFRTVRTVIVDEIHTVCGNKRGVHLALSLERLESLAEGPLQRIGLSATQRPLEEVARFLGGYTWQQVNDQMDRILAPRPVTIVDAGHQKALDLQVVTMVRDFRDVPGRSIWSSIVPQVLDLVRRHRTTLIFANSRRQVERCADRLNEQFRAESEEEIPPGSTEALSPGGVPKGIGFLGTGVTDGPFRAHHGSISRTARLQLERDLKEGRLPALVGTSSLELGIDIGAVDLVVQLQSPKGIARGLQRVGRSGHLVGQTSVGRIFATHTEDIMESAAVAEGMLTGDVEPTFTPQNCLDVLAQQIVAMVSVQDWDVSALFDLVRCAYPYHHLSPALYHAVLDMLSGKYPSSSFREMRPRIAWDRVHDRLTALPGSRLLALRNGGTIPDRGSFGVYLPDRMTKIGELDEEFVYETRPGDVFTLGSQVWRVMDVTGDRVIVADAPGQMPRMPFWRGDIPYRDYHLGLRVGRFRRLLTERVKLLPSLPGEEGEPWPEEVRETLSWLQKEYALDENSAQNAVSYVRRQLDSMGAISTDRTIILETFTDPLGDARLVVHSCFGGRVNSAWALALTNAFRDRLGVTPEVQTSDDGILFRFPQADRALPLDVVTEMGPAEARERLLLELPNSALFGAQFRINAARALLLPSLQGARRRTPFWLQRLRAKDLLAVAKGFDDFPIVAETYRDCLRDVLDWQHLEEVLRGIAAADIRVVRAETLVPSPVAAGLLFNFMAVYVYEWDAPKVERQIQALAMDRRLLAGLLDEVELADLLRPDAVHEVESQLSRTAEGYQARTVDELAVLIEEAGDLTTDEVLARSGGDGRLWLEELAASRRVIGVNLPTSKGTESRWVAAENYALYRDAFGLPPMPSFPLPEHLLARQQSPDETRLAILRRFLRQRGPQQREDILQRYAFPESWLGEALAQLEGGGEIISGRLTGDVSGTQWCDRRVLERIHQRTLLLLRKEIQPVSIYHYADFLARWHHLHPREKLGGPGALLKVMQQLRAVTAPAVVWERDLLPLRLRDFRPTDLEALFSQGELVWVGSGSRDPQRSRVCFLFRGEGSLFLGTAPGEMLDLSKEARAVWDFLKMEGACFFADLQRALQLDTQMLNAALVELAMAGLVTNDTLSALRLIISGDILPERQERAPLSSLEAELIAWRKEHPRTRLTPLHYREAKRQAAERVRHPPQWSGRWSLVHRIGIWGKDVSPEERAARQAKQLLARHGIVTRASLEEEEGAWDWVSISMQLALMEMRGEVRRGYFVQGLPGVQFAAPEALEQLRMWNAADTAGTEDLVLLNACDPANLFGSGLRLPESEALPAEQNPASLYRLPANYLVLQRGRPILGIANGGERIIAVPEISEGILRQAMRLFIAHVTAPGGLAASPRRIVISLWNGTPALGGPAQPLLESLDFHREPPNMVWDRR